MKKFFINGDGQSDVSIISILKSIVNWFIIMITDIYKTYTYKSPIDNVSAREDFRRIADDSFMFW